MTKLDQQLTLPLKVGEVYKKGDVIKSFRNRYFVLNANYSLEYYANEILYRTPNGTPKGCIDLTTVRSVMMHHETNRPYLVKITTAEREWVLQCYSQNDQKQWMNAITALMQNDKFNGYIPECCAFHTNVRESELLVHAVLRHSYTKDQFIDHSFKRVLKLCKKFYYEEVRDDC
eukprot:CAMPEP_0197036670 /NCGR_PEP_ID=MMETSP1384-20130603/14112_1 /TAXON_ID=29189 /ORGANISM="Ammonia sp." /LENGTH=173 /DNA_ID=CAMNT_0042466869 /DNA_START=364 /DNA_END=885 /DNA_ORIENTATION=-